MAWQSEGVLRCSTSMIRLSCSSHSRPLVTLQAGRPAVVVVSISVVVSSSVVVVGAGVEVVVVGWVAVVNGVVVVAGGVVVVTSVVQSPVVVSSPEPPVVVSEEQSSRRGEVGPLMHPSHRSMVSQEASKKHWLPR